MMEVSTYKIEIGEEISEELSTALRKHVGQSDYKEIADKHNIGWSTLKSLTYGDRKINKKNLPGFKLLLRKGIQNAQISMESRQVIVDHLGEDESTALIKLNEALNGR